MFFAEAAAIALAGSAWTVSEQVDPITDKAEVTATLEGDNAKLIFMCSAGERFVLVYQPGVFLGGRGSSYELRDFISRFDDAPAQRDSWKYLNTYAAAYSTKAARSFITSMANSKKLIVRAQRYDGVTVDSSFDLTGTMGAMGQAFSACGLAFP